MEKDFRVSHAEIKLQGLGEHGPSEYFRSALKESWVAGTQVTRYSRTWRLSRFTRPEDGLWAGHIGFVREGDFSTVEWDEAKKDFIRGEASSGVVVPFLISDVHCLVTFQLIPGEVRPTTVTGSLQALLSANGTHFWTIRQFKYSKTIDQWLESVGGVSTFKVRLLYPNPNWTGRQKIRDMMSELKAGILDIKAKAEKDGYIDISSDLSQQAMDHVRLGYGRATLIGSDLNTKDDSRFVLDVNGGAVETPIVVPSGEDDIEVSNEVLMQTQHELLEAQSRNKVVVDIEDELNYEEPS